MAAFPALNEHLIQGLNTVTSKCGCTVIMSLKKIDKFRACSEFSFFN